MSRQLIVRLFSLGIAAALLLGLGWRLLNIYGAPRMDLAEYREPTREFLNAAASQDSLGLVQLASSAEVVGWGLDLARRDASLLHRLQRAVPSSAKRARGATLVWYSVPGTAECSTWPLAISFTGSGRDLRVEHVSVSCER